VDSELLNKMHGEINIKIEQMFPSLKEMEFTFVLYTTFGSYVSYLMTLPTTHYV
jgi:hypothetical protein